MNRPMHIKKTVAAALLAALLFSFPLWAGDVLMSQTGFAQWLAQIMLPTEQKLSGMEAWAAAAEARLDVWKFENLHRLFLWPDRVLVEYYSPGGIPAGTGNLDVPPQIVAGRTMAPLRFIGEALGAEVSWHEENRQVRYHLGERQIVLTVDERTVFVDGQAMEIDTAPTIINSRTMVPVRFISQWLGAVVKWDSDLQRIEISYAK